MIDLELPELKQMGTQALQDLLNNLTQAKGFILEQAPDFCQQLVDRGMWIPGFVALVCAVSALALWLAAGIAILHAARNKEWDVHHILIGVYGSCVAAGLTISAFVNAHNALSVYIAPKVYLVEEITRMLK